MYNIPIFHFISQLIKSLTYATIRDNSLQLLLYVGEICPQIHGTAAKLKPLYLQYYQEIVHQASLIHPEPFETSLEACNEDLGTQIGNEMCKEILISPVKI